MKIRSVTLYPFSIPLVRAFRIATMTSTDANGVFVRIETEAGVVGWGEATPLHSINGETQGTVIETLKVLGSSVIGRKVSERHELAQLFVKLMPGQTAAMSALEMAIHDAFAREIGVSVARLFGGEVKSLPTDITIGITGPEDAAIQAKALMKKVTFKFKVKTGESPESDFDRVSAVREVVGTHSIRVDANQGYSAPVALRALELLAPLDIEFCEQPVLRHDYAGLKWLHDRSPIPIMADESCFGPEDAAHLAQQNACSLVNVKVCKAGGLQRSAQVADVAYANGMRCMMGGMVETRLGVTAAAQLAMVHPAFEYFDLDAFTSHESDFIDGGVQIKAGFAVCEETPGLGAVPDQSFLDTLTKIDV